MIGACTNHSNPDMWFPEYPVGRPTQRARIKTMESAIAAMNICQTCPIQAKCLTEGMKEENIEHGIWGGMLPGDRIVLARTRRSNELRRDAIAFAERVKAWQEIS